MGFLTGRDKGTKANEPRNRRRIDDTCGHGRPVTRGGKVYCDICAGDERGMQGQYRNGRKVGRHATR